jgi:translation initiation factor 2D
MERNRKHSSANVLQRSWQRVGSLITPHCSLYWDPCSPSKLYAVAELRTLVNSYISANSLPNPQNQALIRLDPLLNALLIASKENIDELRREDILNRLCSKMQPWHSISQNERNSTKYVSFGPG